MVEQPNKFASYSCSQLFHIVKLINIKIELLLLCLLNEIGQYAITLSHISVQG